MNWMQGLDVNLTLEEQFMLERQVSAIKTAESSEVVKFCVDLMRLQRNQEKLLKKAIKRIAELECQAIDNWFTND